MILNAHTVDDRDDILYFFWLHKNFVPDLSLPSWKESHNWHTHGVANIIELKI